MAITQGLVTGPVVKYLGEWNTVVLAIASSLVASLGYGLAPNVTIVILLFLVHAPEGFAQPALTALMSREAPDNAQGELQGGIASLQNIAMLAGTFFYAQAFGWFMAPSPVMVTLSAGFFFAAGLLALIIAAFVIFGRLKPVTPR